MKRRLIPTTVIIRNALLSELDPINIKGILTSTVACCAPSFIVMMTSDDMAIVGRDPSKSKYCISRNNIRIMTSFYNRIWMYLYRQRLANMDLGNDNILQTNTDQFYDEPRSDNRRRCFKALLENKETDSSLYTMYKCALDCDTTHMFVASLRDHYYFSIIPGMEEKIEYIKIHKN
jgi:hypothetical protein